MARPPPPTTTKHHPPPTRPRTRRLNTHIRGRQRPAAGSLLLGSPLGATQTRRPPATPGSGGTNTTLVQIIARTPSWAATSDANSASTRMRSMTLLVIASRSGATSGHSGGQRPGRRHGTLGGGGGSRDGVNAGAVVAVRAHHVVEDRLDLRLEQHPRVRLRQEVGVQHLADRDAHVGGGAGLAPPVEDELGVQVGEQAPGAGPDLHPHLIDQQRLHRRVPQRDEREPRGGARLVEVHVVAGAQVGRRGNGHGERGQQRGLVLDRRIDARLGVGRAVDRQRPFEVSNTPMPARSQDAARSGTQAPMSCWTR
jgi:hypothetical protein